MRLSEEVRKITEDKIKYEDYMSNEAYFEDLHRSIYYNELLPKIEQLEKDKEELIDDLKQALKLIVEQQVKKMGRDN